MPHPLVISLMVILSNRLVCSSFNNDSVKALFVLMAITILPSFFPITAFLSYTLRTARLPPNHSAPFLPPACLHQGENSLLFPSDTLFLFTVLFPCRTGNPNFPVFYPFRVIAYIVTDFMTLATYKSVILCTKIISNI